MGLGPVWAGSAGEASAAVQRPLALVSPGLRFPSWRGPLTSPPALSAFEAGVGILGRYYNPTYKLQAVKIHGASGARRPSGLAPEVEKAPEQGLGI